jgi:hypothetical protein
LAKDCKLEIANWKLQIANAADQAAAVCRARTNRRIDQKNQKFEIGLGVGETIGLFGPCNGLFLFSGLGGRTRAE